MATFHIRPNGRLQIDLCLYGRRFREGTCLMATPTNIKKITAMVKQINAQLALKCFDYRQWFPDSRKLGEVESFVRDKSADAHDPRVDEVIEQWYQHSLPGWKSSYRQLVRGVIDQYLLPFFDGYRISQLTTRAALDLRLKLTSETRSDGSARLGHARVNCVFVQLSSVANYARDVLGHDCPYQPLKSLRKQPTDPHPLTLPEVRRFLDAVPPEYGDYYLLRFFTGMRDCEIHGLRHEDVDFEHRLIRVRVGWVRGELTTLKTSRSRRDIPMIDPVYEALQRACGQSRARGIFVFSNASGSPLDANRLRAQVWYPALKQAGISQRRPYQTRHTAAVLHLAAHENPLFVSRLLGHSSTRMLFEVYAPFVANAARNDGSAFEQMVMAGVPC